MTLVWLAFSAGAAAAQDLLVFAAASLKEPMDAIAQDFGGVTVSYAGSGTVARQVLAGAPADVVMLANAAWMETLTTAGLVADPVDLLGNELVVIAPAGAAPLALDGIGAALGNGRLAVGLTRAVPAGIYAAEALQSLGLWDDLRGLLAEVDNVRGVLALVARKEVPLGIVYATDARVTDAVQIVAVFPAETHSDIIYTVAAVTETGQAFVAYLQGPAAAARFADAGFRVR